MLQLGFDDPRPALLESLYHTILFSFFSIPVSGGNRCSGPQKFSDFESDVMTGWVEYGRLVRPLCWSLAWVDFQDWAWRRQQSCF